MLMVAVQDFDVDAGIDHPAREQTGPAGTPTSTGMQAGGGIIPKKQAESMEDLPCRRRQPQADHENSRHREVDRRIHSLPIIRASVHSLLSPGRRAVARRPARDSSR